MAQRLFAAIDLDHAVREQLARAIAAVTGGEQARAGVRWLPPANWHLTLQFFGRVPDEKVDGLLVACDQAACAGAPFAVELEGAGAFPSPRRARLLWVGVRQGHAQVAALADALTRFTEPLGFAREQRPFRSHVTVARLKAPSDVQRLLDSLRPPSLPMQVTAMTLFRSHVTSRGAEYEALRSFALGNS